jgi:predicted RNase H-like nuclease (RuvC/YqgF family)
MDELDKLRAEVADLRACCEKQAAQLELYEASLSSCLRKAQWQARTNKELNALREQLQRYRTAMDRIYNHNEAAMVAVIQHFGVRHD